MRRRSISGSFIGIALLILGVGFLFNSLGMINFGDYLSKYWPALILLLALIKLLESRWVSAGLWFIVGAILLNNTATNTHIDFWQMIWPIILIWIGASILLRRHSWKPEVVTETGDRTNILSVFSASDKKITSKNFTGTNITNVFGATKLDLRNAEIADEGAIIDVVAVFGGLEIIVPKDMPVKIDVLAIIGGTDDKRGIEEDSKAKLRIRGTVVFGGVEIKE